MILCIAGGPGPGGGPPRGRDDGELGGIIIIAIVMLLFIMIIQIIRITRIT